MATTEKCYNNASNDGVSDDCVNDVDDSNTVNIFLKLEHPNIALQFK